MFVCLGIAEIGGDAVAHMFGDITTGLDYCLGNSSVIGAKHLSQIFRIETRRQLEQAAAVPDRANPELAQIVRRQAMK